LILPVPVLLKRFFAPVWVFNLGIFFSFVRRGWPCRNWHPGVLPVRQGFPCLLEASTSIAQKHLLEALQLYSFCETVEGLFGYD
jgi:hypothetical protein